MGDNEAFVLVYRYRYWDAEKNEMVVSPQMATLESIRNGLGIPVIETGMKVKRSQVDEHGRYAVRASPYSTKTSPSDS